MAREALSGQGRPSVVYWYRHLILEPSFALLINLACDAVMSIAGKHEAAFKEYMACLRDDINERVIDAWFPKLRELGRENEIDRVCKEMYPR